MSKKNIICKMAGKGIIYLFATIWLSEIKDSTHKDENDPILYTRPSWNLEMKEKNSQR